MTRCSTSGIESTRSAAVMIATGVGLINEDNEL